MVFRENAVIVAVGSVAGLSAAILASRTLASFLDATSPRDPWVPFASLALLPALRAARIEPMAAIRYE
jgi:hypothetical protein